MRRVTAVLVLALAAACGSDEDAGPSREDLVNALVDGGLEPVEARCWVGEVYDDLSLEDKEAIQRADDSYDDFEDPDKVRAAGNACQ